MVRRFVWMVWAVCYGLMGCAPVNAEESVSLPAESPAPSLTSSDLTGEEAPSESQGPQRISMEFQGVSLGNVLKTFSQETGINVIAAEEVSDKPVTIYLEDVEVLDALDQILKAGNLTYERPPGSRIYIVKPQTEAEATPKTITRVYQLKYARVSQSVLAKTAAVFAGKTPFEASLTTSTTSASSSSSGSGSSAGGADSDTSGVGVDVILRRLLSEHGNITVDGRTNRLIITDVSENFPRLEAVLAALDIRTPQILVNAEILETTLNKIRDLGIEWGGSTGSIFTLTPGQRLTRFPFNWIGHQDTPALTDPSTSRFGASTLSFAGFTAAMQALEKDTDTKILARPKVLTLDNESALIRLTADETIGFEVTTGEQTATTSSTPERETTGVVLVVTPQVNANGYITMIVEPSVTKTVASLVTPPSGQATTRDPKTRSSRAIVRVRSGETLVMGGLIDQSDQLTHKRLPLFAKIPVIGSAFKNDEVNNTTSELIVFITPTILQESPETSRVASAELDHVATREQQGLAARQDRIERALNRLEDSSQ